MAAKGIESIIEIIAAGARAAGATDPLAPQNPESELDK